MPKYDVKSPDGITYEVNAPDGATEDEAIAYVQRNFYKPNEDIIQPSAGIGDRLGNLYEGAKLAVSAPFIGGGNLAGIVPDERVKQFKQDVSANMDKPGGFGGQVIGGGLAAAPAMAIPGMQWPAAQMALGGLYGLTYPAENWKERAINTGSGVAGSGAGYLAGSLLNKANSPFLNSAQRKAMDDASRNSMRDTALSEGRAAGYVIPRSDYAAQPKHPAPGRWLDCVWPMPGAVLSNDRCFLSCYLLTALPVEVRRSPRIDQSSPTHPQSVHFNMGFPFVVVPPSTSVPTCLHDHAFCRQSAYSALCLLSVLPHSGQRQSAVGDSATR
jgi:hypothetical protein